MRQPERGNVLFLILLAVILFAALSYAVTASLRGNGKDGSVESASAVASEIVNYTTQVEQTVMRLRLSNGCGLNEIDFENLVDTSYAPHAFPRADKKCNVFDPAGGNMAWKTVPAKWMASATEAASYSQSAYPADYQTFNFPNTVCVQNISASTCTNNLPSEKALVVGLKYLDKSVCDAINQQLGQTTGAGVACNPAGDTSRYKGTFFAGTYVCGGSTSGIRMKCLFSLRTGYTFYHIIEAQ